MHATVVGLAVASIMAASSLSAQETAAATVTANQDSSRAATAPAPSGAGVDTLQLGGRIIGAGDSVTGPVLVIGGDLRVQAVRCPEAGNPADS